MTSKAHRQLISDILVPTLTSCTLKSRIGKSQWNLQGVPGPKNEGG